MCATIAIAVCAVGYFAFFHDWNPYDAESLMGRSYDDIVDQYGEFYVRFNNRFANSDIKYYGVIEVTRIWEWEPWYVTVAFDENDTVIKVSERSESYSATSRGF